MISSKFDISDFSYENWLVLKIHYDSLTNQLKEDG